MVFNEEIIEKSAIAFLKCPINFENVSFQDRRLYINYLDCKSQSVEGIFKVYNTPNKRNYYRMAKKLIDRGWASPCRGGENGNISLRAYQFVWRDLGIPQMHVQTRSAFVYFKIEREKLSTDRETYVKEIDTIIKRYSAKRRAAQIRWNLNKQGLNSSQANFSAMSAALLFGYRSVSSGSKLRKENFSMIEGKSIPYYNKVRGRFEEPTKRIAL